MTWEDEREVDPDVWKLDCEPDGEAKDLWKDFWSLLLAICSNLSFSRVGVAEAIRAKLELN